MTAGDIPASILLVAVFVHLDSTLDICINLSFIEEQEEYLISLEK